MDPAVIASVVNSNFKLLGDMPGHAAGLSIQNATSHQQALNAASLNAVNAFNTLMVNSVASFSQIQAAATGAIVKSLTELDAIEAMSNAVIGQQGAKVAQTTPPETGKTS